MQRLNQLSLKEIDAIAKPTYNRNSVKAGILHIGLGNFHRAHQADYLDRYLAQNKSADWGIVSSSIRSEQSALCTSMGTQNGLFTLTTKSPHNQCEYRIIGSILEVIDGAISPELLLEKISDPNIKIITTTVTEGGYYLTPDNETLQLDHPDIQSDLSGQFRTLYAYLRAGLQQRAKKHGCPVTLLSSDNLRLNGDSFKKGFHLYLDLVGDKKLSVWVEQNVSFPNSMVDRITPKTEPKLNLDIQSRFGFIDRVPVMAEDHIQWVIEDCFINGRPDLEGIGVEIVDNIYEKEEAKIRILNGGHCAVAWLAAHKGFRFCHEALNDSEIESFFDDYIHQEVLPTLDFVSFDLLDYCKKVKSRFENQNIPDTVERLASEGFSRLPKFVLPVIYDRLQKRETADLGLKILACWYAALKKNDENRLGYHYQDQEIELINHWFRQPNPFQSFVKCQEMWGCPENIKDVFEANLENAFLNLSL